MESDGTKEQHAQRAMRKKDLSIKTLKRRWHRAKGRK